MRQVSQLNPISDDLLLGRLNEDLPSSFKPVSIPSTNIVRYLSSGKYLPLLSFNQEKGATVLELTGWDTETRDKYGNQYRHYSETGSTNFVTHQRSNIRLATVDGNSSCPSFIVVGNKLALLYIKHLGYKEIVTGSTSWGPAIPFRGDLIQDNINEWEGANANLYQLEQLDMSVFDEIVNFR